MLAGQNIRRRTSKYNGVRVGSWNVLSLYRSGALKNLIGMIQECLLLNIVLEKAARDSGIETRGTILKSM
jgi:hypothetical protein